MGLPNGQLIDVLKANNIKMGLQVTGGESAATAMALKPDFLVCQGVEAGGHVQADLPLMTALEQALLVAGEVPVLASGGMATGQDISAYLNAGAAGAVLGTRFVATQESVAHSDYKQQLVVATSADETVLTVCLNKAWPNATHRILRKNQSYSMWDRAGRPPGPYYIGAPAGDRPGEHDVVAIDENGTVLERYTGIVPIASMDPCNADALGNYAGYGVGEIADLPPAGELVVRLWSEVTCG